MTNVAIATRNAKLPSRQGLGRLFWTGTHLARLDHGKQLEVLAGTVQHYAATTIQLTKARK